MMLIVDKTVHLNSDITHTIFFNFVAGQ